MKTFWPSAFLGTIITLIAVSLQNQAYVSFGGKACDAASHLTLLLLRDVGVKKPYVPSEYWDQCGDFVTKRAFEEACFTGLVVWVAVTILFNAIFALMEAQKK